MTLRESDGVGFILMCEAVCLCRNVNLAALKSRRMLRLFLGGQPYLARKVAPHIFRPRSEGSQRPPIKEAYQTITAFLILRLTIY